MASRKLQGDIDRVLKRVSEGVQEFNETYDKLYQCTNANQREKYDQDLKKEIKKLQRLRDQIRTWIGSNDVKDKRALIENRKLIETQMERFKACEKEMKTKAFSKDGLLMSEKLDPKEIERRELIEWVVQKIEELNLQIEKVEAEAEKLRGTAKKGKKDAVKMTRATALEHTVERERWHVGRLELINRLLENCVVMTDKNAGFIDNVAQLQEDIQYYVDHNQEPDFMEDDEMYASLNLEEEEEMYVVGDIDHHDAHEADESRPTEPPTPDRDDHGHKKGFKDHDETLSPAKDKQPPNKSNKGKEEVKGKTADAKARQNGVPVVSPVKEKPDQPPQPPQQRFAAATATPTGLKTTAAVVAAQSAKPPIATGFAAVAAAGAAPVLPATSKSVERHQPPGTQRQTSPQRAARRQVSPQRRVTSPNNRNNSPQRAGVRPASPGKGSRPVTSDVDGPAESRRASKISAAGEPLAVGQHDTERGAAENWTPAVETEAAGELPVQDKLPRLEQAREVRTPPSSLRELVHMFDRAKERVNNPIPADPWPEQMLDVSFAYAPDAVDAERRQPYIPRTPWPTPAHYPQASLPHLEAPAIFERFNADSLFFIFYYVRGTHSQFLAARELKRQSWRFHKQYLTWFQRHEEPKVVTDDYEQGSYVYFDYEGAWCQRKKNDFRFEYAYLEDELQP